jgi:hypothetical protein
MTLKLTTFRLEEELLEALQRIKDRDGIPVSEQVRRALQRWVVEKGEKVEVKVAGSPRRRVGK